MHHLLIKEVHHEVKNEMRFVVNDSRLRFGLGEFALVTGLKCKGDTSIESIAENRLISKYFGTASVTFAQLADCFKKKKWETDDDALKIAVLYFVNSFLFSQLKTKAISRSYIDLVESGDFNNYPWGIDVYKATIDSCSNKFQDKPSFYRLGGFPLALQTWLYECCPSLDGHFAYHLGNKLPRILNWLKNITPTDDEKKQFDVRGLSFEIEVECTDSQPSQPDSFQVFGTQLPKTQSMPESTGGDSQPTNAEVMKELQALKLFVENKFEEVLAAIGKQSMKSMKLEENSAHLNIIFYYLRKKAKYGINMPIKVTTTDTLFNNIIQRVFKEFVKGGKQDHLIDRSDDIMQYMKGFRMHCNTPWHQVDHVLFPINLAESWHWILGCVSFHKRCFYVYDSLRSRKHKKAIQNVTEAYAVLIPLFLVSIEFYSQRSDIVVENGLHMGKNLTDPFEIELITNLPTQQNSSSADVLLSQVGTDLFEPEVLWGNSPQTALTREVNSVATTVEEAFAAPNVSNDRSIGNLDFLNNDYPGDAALSVGSGGMQVPYLLNVEDSYSTVGSDSGFRTGIKLRTLLKQNQPDDKQFGSGMQGTSHKRIRFQMKLQAGSVHCRVPIDSDKGGANYKGLLTVPEVSLPNPSHTKEKKRKQKVMMFASSSSKMASSPSCTSNVVIISVFPNSAISDEIGATSKLEVLAAIVFLPNDTHRGNVVIPTLDFFNSM
ncbi:hypothetical protein A4A49_10615 [Nicotiana attenuata]|uniref:Ubiquitin-like protease family profile domain-containing protein n=1 Tax=Nicotiana attenuata TaxID=49451 RepID=A0A314KQR7_NICAT|nr:hypothetical protein A4A49_10615 [Nicotiana attenuata]